MSKPTKNHGYPQKPMETPHPYPCGYSVHRYGYRLPKKTQGSPMLCPIYNSTVKLFITRFLRITKLHSLLLIGQYIQLWLTRGQL